MTRSRRLDWARGRSTSDLSRRLGQLECLSQSLSQTSSQKGVSVSGSSMPPRHQTFDVGDDDDDVHISSPRSLAQAKSRQQSRSVIEITEDPLELRLGPNFLSSTSSSTLDTNTPRGRSDRTATPTIDLTGPSPPFYDADCILVNEFVQKKRKPHIVTLETLLLEPTKELKLTCAICMDSMKEETSTICGHLFCRGCILGAIAVQKKCPTCGQKLTVTQTHRIFLATSASPRIRLCAPFSEEAIASEILCDMLGGS